MKDVFCGIDEAGRGPVIGSLVMACVCLDEKSIRKLKGLGVRDSKKMTPKKREELEPVIKELALEWSTIKITPQEIDKLRKKKSLNVIEADKTAELILSLTVKPSKIFVDATDSIAKNYEKKIIDQIVKLNPEYKIPKMVCEHRADDKYIPASAASVIAKVERDREIEELKKEYGNIGSGYPSDERTQKFVRKLVREGSLPSFVRRSWGTVNKLKQSSLSEF